MARCALSEDDEMRLRDHVQSKGMIFISTPFSRAAADRLEQMDVPAYKIGSGECNNYPLLRHIASFGKPVILSTGMNTIESVRKAVASSPRGCAGGAAAHHEPISNAAAPGAARGDDASWRRRSPDSVYGLSDHTTDNLACFAAIALGASIVERHFTDHMGREGPDIVCSMDEPRCRELIEARASSTWNAAAARVPRPRSR